MSDSAETMREALEALASDRRIALAAEREVACLVRAKRIAAALSASGTKSDGAKAIKTALIAAGCDTGDGSYVHAAMDSVIAAILAMQAERRADNTVQRDRIYRAAERSNTRFGQWMPERWVNIFVEELNK